MRFYPVRPTVTSCHLEDSLATECFSKITSSFMLCFIIFRLLCPSDLVAVIKLIETKGPVNIALAWVAGVSFLVASLCDEI